MATNVLMPQLGESIAEGTIVRWNKAVGDRVERDEPLFEVSTDKVDAEVPAPAGGVITEVRAEVGETVPVDSVVAVIGTEGEMVVPAPAEPSSGATTRARPSGTAVTPSGDASPRPRGLSPIVRRLAREHGIDPTTIVGTGAGGRVTKEDVLGHVRSGDSAGSAGAPDSARAAREDAGARVEPRSTAGARVEPLSTMRRQIAEHMVRSRRTSAHVHTMFDVDFTAVAALRAERREATGAAPTYLAFIAKAVADALAEVPVVNASLTSDGTDVIHHGDVNLGIAVALDHDDGLIVPVVHGAAGLGVAELGRRITELATRARARTLTPDAVQRGTFTITNPGGFGSVAGLPIINQPQVAILCVGAIERRPVVAPDGAIVARWRSYLTLGFDHRLIDGAVADRFMSLVKTGLEQVDTIE